VARKEAHQLSLDSVLDWDSAPGSLSVVGLLTRAYWMEIQTVMSYLAASMGGDGSLGAAVVAALARGVDDEVEHTRALGRRIQELHGALPGDHGPAEFHPVPGRQPDERAMIESVIAAELNAIHHYSRIMRATVDSDRDTHALALGILHEERRHLQLFERFLRECRPAAVTA
jgi:bacterioferritin